MKGEISGLSSMGEICTCQHSVCLACKEKCAYDCPFCYLSVRPFNAKREWPHVYAQAYPYPPTDAYAWDGIPGNQHTKAAMKTVSRMMQIFFDEELGVSRESYNWKDFDDDILACCNECSETAEKGGSYAERFIRIWNGIRQVLDNKISLMTDELGAKLAAQHADMIESVVAMRSIRKRVMKRRRAYDDTLRAEVGGLERIIKRPKLPEFQTEEEEEQQIWDNVWFHKVLSRMVTTKEDVAEPAVKEVAAEAAAEDAVTN